MKKVLIMLVILLVMSAVSLSCHAADIDPILLDKPSDLVFECNENLFFEILVNPVIEYATGGRHAKDQFLFLTSEFLFLEEKSWKGLDKTSFELRHVKNDGSEESYPLNYAMTVMLAMKNGWLTLSDTLSFGTLTMLPLVFDINTLDKNGWTLIFRPAERGGSAVCEVEIPLKVQK